MKERISYQEVTKGVMDGMMKSESHIKKSGLDLKLVELMNYRVSQINGCAYCLDMHHKKAVHMGETELRLHTLSVWRECPYYSEKERAVLAFAETVTLTHQKHLGDELFQDLEKFFSKAEIVDLTLAVAQINSWNRISKVLGTTPGNYQVTPSQ